MKTQEMIVSAVSAAILAICFAKPAHAHGCSGPGACQTIQHNPQASANGGAANSTNTTSSQGGSSYQRQQQGQEQYNDQVISGGNSRNDVNSHAGSMINQTYSSRHIDLIPVQTAQPITITPASSVRRYAGHCGPRMVIRARDVDGRYYGALSTDTFVAGEDHQVLPAVHPYNEVQIAPGLKHLLGHRLIETSAVVTVSGGRSIGIGGVGTNGGGSATSGGSGAMQRLVTTVRLEECVAYELREKPPVPVRKPRPKVKRKPAPKCQVCVN